MSLPKLLRDVFENDGAGPKFRADKVPVDTALSATSTNAVQNKIVKAQLDTKLTEATLRTALTELITEYGGTVPE